MTSWSVLVPQKALNRAKSRLDLPPDRRRALAEAMLRDTLDAVRTTPGVEVVTVLWDDAADAARFPGTSGRPTAGMSLNEAVAAGQERCRAPGTAIAVVPGDLPALSPEDLSRCLARAAESPRAFLADITGTGTTILTAGPEHRLVIRYGPGSAAAHAAAGVSPIPATGLEAARTDVDDLDSLARSLGSGCGHHTLAACARLRLVLETTTRKVNTGLTA